MAIEHERIASRPKQNPFQKIRTIFKSERSSEETSLNHLLEVLSASPTELQPKYAELARKAEKLPDDYYHSWLTGGKVGIELEYNGPKFDIPGFNCFSDLSNNELAREKGHLTFDAAYAKTLTNLIRLLNQHQDVKHLSSFHIHLDNIQFPHAKSATLNDLFFRSGDEIRLNENNGTTTELRGAILPFDSKGKVDSEILNQFICLLMLIGKNGLPKAGDKIKLEQTAKNWRELVWGFLCVHLQDPHQRLIGLRILSNQHLLSVINPLALATAYTKNQVLIESLTRSFDQKRVSNQLKTLKKIISNDSCFRLYGILPHISHLAVFLESGELVDHKLPIPPAFVRDNIDSYLKVNANNFEKIDRSIDLLIRFSSSYGGYGEIIFQILKSNINPFIKKNIIENLSNIDPKNIPKLEEYINHEIDPSLKAIAQQKLERCISISGTR